MPSGGVATFDNVTFVKLGGQAGSPFSPRFTATDSQRADSTGALALTVGPAAIAITAPTAPVRAGESFSLTVTIDALGGAPEDRRDYAGSVTFAAPDDPTADLPAPLAFTAQNRGVRTASVTLRSPGAQTVRVQDETNGVSGSFSLTVLPAAPPGMLKITPLHWTSARQPATAPTGTSDHHRAPQRGTTRLERHGALELADPEPDQRHDTGNRLRERQHRRYAPRQLQRLDHRETGGWEH